MEILVLRFDAPLMSFGGPAVDQQRVTQDFPAQSMLAGLFSNALGYDHRDAPRTQRLQERIQYAVRRDRRGSRLADYQTVDLGQDFMKGSGWTTSGQREHRGGAFSEGTHIRTCHYIADALYTLAVALEPGSETPTLRNLETALLAPARPLFLGRKACLPASPLVVGCLEAANLMGALESTRRSTRADAGQLTAWWPAPGGSEAPGARLIPVTDARDWINQIHVGRRFVLEGLIDPPEAPND